MRFVLAILAALLAPCAATAVEVVQPQLTPVAPSGSRILAAGATAQPLATAGTVLHGCKILNPLSLAQENIAAAESIFVSIDGTTAVLTSSAGSFEVQPGGTFDCPTGLTTGISWIATTINHRITAVVW